MTDRVLDFSLEPARLSIRNALLVVETGGLERAAIPCEEIAAVLISHRQVTFTQSVLSELAKAGAITLTCDEKCMPAAMVLPVDAHHAQAERFRLQAALGLPRKKRLWQSVVRAKIRAQARAMSDITGSDEGLNALVAKVASGDSANVEARAARRYWSRIFGDGFARNDSEDPRNSFLNYGYAVLRAITARAVCAAGLHPSFCLFHSNVHNPFGLADDLMEPFRPVVDRIAVQLANDAAATQRECELSPEIKRQLIAGIIGRFEVEGECRSLSDILIRVAQSLAAVIMGSRESLWLPEWNPVPPLPE